MGQLADGLSRNGWGASAIDAFSTALIMGNTEVVSQILDFVPEIDFSVSFNDTVVSVFETTIRYLGGLLSGTKSERAELQLWILECLLLLTLCDPSL